MHVCVYALCDASIVVGLLLFIAISYVSCVHRCAANSPCPGAWKKFRGFVKHCVHNDIFEFVIFVFIIASTVVLVRIN